MASNTNSNSQSSPFFTFSFSDGTNNMTEEQAEQFGVWLTETLIENPQLLSLRERVLPWTGGYSFANVIHSDTMTTSNHINRFTTLELIFQHLNAIGMHQTAEILERESGHKFQNILQPWDRTDLHLLVSTGVLPREDPWQVADEPHHHFMLESLEEDFFATPYTEDYSSIYKEILDPTIDVKFSGNVQSIKTMKAASLRRFVVFLTLSPSDQLSDDDLTKFLLIIHSFTSSHHFFQHLCAIFDAAQADMSDEDYQRIKAIEKNNQKAVINLLKKWTNLHGLFIGRRTIKSIGHFLQKILSDQVNYPDLQKFAKSNLDLLPTLTYGTRTGTLMKPTDQPIIENPQVLFKPSLSLIEPNSTEVARQITLIFHASFKAVHSHEFFVALSNQSISPQTPTLTEFQDIGRKLERQILEIIALAKDKIAAINKILDIAQKLEELGNFDALSWIIKALERDVFTRLPLMTDPKIANLILKLDTSAGVHINNTAQYFEQVMTRFDKWDSSIPNIQTEMLSFKTDDSSMFIDGLLNIDKMKPFADKIAVLYRFQNKFYNFYPISQIQKIIIKGPTMSEEQILAKLADLDH
ncbi:RasGEF domain containing protein [Histomonas meleagridis]|uniref:RasGEF domain containing protein n=1 Tax=Histomonas meleagridis TaxID=135588 RepID=UPI003559D54A|nr:RasGEF domain containing protein [Histomonas meleagridis]KAH0798786.1 RasGEF domain containing protein [Histomonas meleagridis]